MPNINIEIDNIKQIFDVTPRGNCCNCIAIVLYISKRTFGEYRDADVQSFNYLHDKLNSMCMSLKIVSKALPTFIVRYYLDSSIFETLKFIIIEKKLPIPQIQNIIDNLKFIINHTNSEVFMYFCKNIIENPTRLARTRTYRFLPFLNIERDTNVCVIREADGIVSLADCHNINLFANSETHKIIMTYDFASSVRYLLNIAHTFDKLLYWETDAEKPRIRNLNHYNKWLNIYENIFKKNISLLEPQHMQYINIDNKLSYIDLLAGVFAIKVHLKMDYINHIIKQLDNIYNTIINGSDYQDKHIMADKSTESYKSRFVNEQSKNEYINAWKERIIFPLEGGYDEILLMELFAPLIRVSFVKTPQGNILNTEEISLKESLLVIILWQEFDFDYNCNVLFIEEKKPKSSMRQNCQTLLQTRQLKQPDKYLSNDMYLLNDVKMSVVDFNRIYNKLLSDKDFVFPVGANKDHHDMESKHKKLSEHPSAAASSDGGFHLTNWFHHCY